MKTSLYITLWLSCATIIGSLIDATFRFWNAADDFINLLGIFTLALCPIIIKFTLLINNQITKKV
jgi:hypothetical protein